jgi:uncharacterized protein YifE (UPF0438 family)
MNDEKSLHLSYIKDRPKFKIRCNRSIFSEEEIEILEYYGHWFEALTSGELKPISERQKFFVEVGHDKRDPFSPEEKAWFKYLKRVAIEKEKGDKLYIKHYLPDDPFYSRVGAKHLRKGMSSTIGKEHYR